MVVWLTGLSGAGKTTLALELERELCAAGRQVFRLDGDDLRRGLCSDLGFSAQDRAENIRRAAEVCRLLVDSGAIVLAAFISPFARERASARNIIEAGGRSRFVEVFVDTPLTVAELRDVKGLYRRARAGELKEFTGIDSPYEIPVNPEIVVTTVNLSPGESAQLVMHGLLKLGSLKGTIKGDGGIKI